MITSSTLFMLILLIVSLIVKNQSLMAAVLILLMLKWSGLGEKLFPIVQQKGINWGVTVITIAVLVPIVTGEIGLKELIASLKSYYAWIALIAGILVAIIAANGIVLLQDSPQMTAVLVFGTIIAVTFFKGVAVGPLIGAGIAYLAMRLVEIAGSISN